MLLHVHCLCARTFFILLLHIKLKRHRNATRLLLLPSFSAQGFLYKHIRRVLAAATTVPLSGWAGADCRGRRRREGRANCCKRWSWTRDQSSTGARITRGGARSGRRAAARSSAAAIATTMPRIHWLSASATVTRSLAMKSSWSVICSLCNNEQEVKQDCSNCGARLGKYFCGKCNFFDDDVSKNQFHCDRCGICRTGGADNFFHCEKCGCCYSFVLKDSHRCVDRAMHQNCPICFEYMFESARDINVLRCGHMIHVECLREMRAHRRFSCPVCLKSACDMSDAWQKLDRQVAASPMPAIQKKMIWILCNDCGAASEVQFHILAHKCPGCSSYNTRQTG